MTKPKALTYTGQDGTVYPLEEATYNTAFKAYRTDQKRAVIADPYRCIEALGLKRDDKVIEAYVGSGRDAYVVFAATDLKPAHAVHFIVSGQAGHVRDSFDQNKALKSQMLILRAPSPSETVIGRRTRNKVARDRHFERVAEGTAKKHPIHRNRQTRLGVGHRPRAKISRNNVTPIPKNFPEPFEMELV